MASTLPKSCESITNTSAAHRTSKMYFFYKVVETCKHHVIKNKPQTLPLRAAGLRWKHAPNLGAGWEQELAKKLIRPKRATNQPRKGSGCQATSRQGGVVDKVASSAGHGRQRRLTRPTGLMGFMPQSADLAVEPEYARVWFTRGFAVDCQLSNCSRTRQWGLIPIRRSNRCARQRQPVAWEVESRGHLLSPLWATSQHWSGRGTVSRWQHKCVTHLSKRPSLLSPWATFLRIFLWTFEVWRIWRI